MDVNDIAEVVHQWTGIPVSQMMETEATKLLHMEERLHERIIGQEEAIHAISDAIRRARSGLKDPSRPIGSFIFIGPSGVGKTELAKALAWFMFDDEDALVRVDMSEYREQHTVSRLFGAPPGYVGYEEGGQLTEAVRRRPYRVVLFDEIEKAHPEVWNALLQILDDGRMTDGQGNVVDFRNTILIMTSNLGTEYVKRGGTLGFLQQKSDDEERESHDKIEKALKGTFRPEFLNRVDEIIMFSPLSIEDMEQIVDLQMKEVQDRLGEYNIQVELTAGGPHVAGQGRLRFRLWRAAAAACHPEACGEPACRSTCWAASTRTAPPSWSTWTRRRTRSSSMQAKPSRRPSSRPPPDVGPARPGQVQCLPRPFHIRRGSHVALKLARAISRATIEQLWRLEEITWSPLGQHHRIGSSGLQSPRWLSACALIVRDRRWSGRILWMQDGNSPLDLAPRWSRPAERRRRPQSPTRGLDLHGDRRTPCPRSSCRRTIRTNWPVA